MRIRSIIEELRDFDTALLASTIDYIDPTPSHEFYMGGTIRSVTPTLGPTVGLAVTCEVDSSTPGQRPEMELFWRQLEQMKAKSLPTVWVVKTVGSRPEHECVFGDGMAKLLHSVGCEGLVTDGHVRDVNGLLTTPFAAYCRGTVIHHCAIRVLKADAPVEIGGITLRPDDLIHANAEGIIKVPSACAAHLTQRAARMRAAEHEVHKLWRRTDLEPRQKQQCVQKVFSEFGFERRINEG